MSSFSAIHKFRSLIREPACYKNPDNPSCVDLIVIDCHKYFQVSSMLETGLSNFHIIMILTVLKFQVPHQQPKVISYRNYTRFDKPKPRKRNHKYSIGTENFVKGF